MRAMILAAGEGRRLRPLTNDIPKPMVPLAGSPILEHSVRLLKNYGIREIVINVHYRPDIVVGYFGDGRKWGVSITYSHEVSLLGTSGAVKKVGSWFGGAFLVLYGDNLTTCNLERLLRSHRKMGGVGTIALFQRQDANSSGIAELDPHDRILRFLEKPGQSQVFSRWVNAGVMALEQEVLEFIPPDCPSDFGRDVIPALIRADKAVYGYRMDEGLWWIDTLDDYRRMVALFERKRLGTS